MLDTVREFLLAGPTSGRRASVALVGRLGAGAIFVVFGAGKFTAHASEVASFHKYGVPAPDAFVYGIGIVELGGGALLLAGLATRLAAIILAGDMVGAILLSGIKHGEPISLTLAPALLAVMLFVLWTGPGRYTLDHRLVGRRASALRPH